MASARSRRGCSKDTDGEVAGGLPGVLDAVFEVGRDLGQAPAKDRVIQALHEGKPLGRLVSRLHHERRFAWDGTVKLGQNDKPASVLEQRIARGHVHSIADDHRLAREWRLVRRNVERAKREEHAPRAPHACSATPPIQRERGIASSH